MKRPVENPASVLLVNDDQVQLDLWRDLLGPEGYRLFTAQTGHHALRVAATARLDVVISDVVMPEMNGMELCRRLKQDAHTASVPVLLMSAIRKEEADVLEGFGAGADDYIQIPFRHEELLVKVARLTERHRVERRYRDIVEQAADIIYTRDMNGFIRSINEAGARFFGRPAFELIGQPLSALIGLDKASTDIAAMKAVKSFEPIRFTDRLSNALGEDRYLEGIVTLERDTSGESLGIRGVVRDVTDRRQAETALQKQNEEYRLLFESNPCPMYVCDCESLAFVAVNRAAIDHYGYSRAEFLQMSARDILADDLAASHNENYNREHGVAFCRHRKRDSVVIDVEVNWHRLDFLGRSSYLVMANDVTEKRQAEVAVLESEKRYRELFENANDIIYTHDLKGNFTSLNKSGEYVTGFTREETLRMNIKDVLAPDYLDMARHMLVRKSDEDVATVYELEIIAKDGRRVALEVSTRLIYASGKPIGVQGIARDITARKGTEEALKYSEEKFRSIVETTNEWIWAIDLAGAHTYTNPAVQQILGYQPHEVLGADVRDFLFEQDRDEFEKVLASGISERRGWAGLVLRWKHRRGGYRYLESNAAPVFDFEGALIGYRGADRDITERKLAEEALAQQAERAALINRISQAVRRSLDVSKVFESAVRELGIHLAVDRCSLYMKDEKAGRAVNAAEFHVPDIEPAGTDFDLPRLKGLQASMEKHGVMAFDDVADDESRYLYQGIVKQDVKSIMYVGITVGNELLGAFALSTTKQLRHWSEADIEVAKAVADQTGIAIRQARLYQKAESTSMREALLNKLGVAIRASLSLTSVLDTASRELGHALSASRVEVRLYDSGGDQSTPRGEYLAEGCVAVPYGDPGHDDLLRARFLKLLAPLVIYDAEYCADANAQLATSIRRQAKTTGVKSQIEYPLTVNGEFRGVISIHQLESVRHWSEDEIILVEAVAAQLATGIAQAELFEMVTRAKKEWESTFDAMSDGIFIFDQNGRLMRVNRAGATMDNAAPETLLGRQCCDILRTSDGVACIVEESLRRSKSINLEIVPQNLARPVLVTVEPVLDERSQTVGAVCTARDLSELRKVQAVARERQSLLKNIMESAREAIYALDTHGRYKWCNQAMLEMTGYTLDEIIGHSFLERTHEDDREMRRQLFASNLAGEAHSFESRYVARDGSVRFAAVNTAPIIVDGETTGVLGIAHDVTEQKQERERAARADKLRALGQLASGVAHDFNNSLAAILGRAQLILRRVHDEELIRSLGIIVTAAEDAASTVRRIQTFARKSLGAEQEALDVTNLLRDAIEITRTRWENEARAAGLNVDVTLKAEDGMITLGNASELREVFVNLIVNAVDAMPEGGSLKICCKRRGDRIQLRFADTGLGMLDDVRERVFEPFYTTKGVHGTGLGLAVSYGIIERHAGSISVESQIGKGSTFYIDLPLVENSASVRDEPELALGTGALSILVIDDEEFVRETLAEMLADLDHEVTTVATGRAGVEITSSQDFDVVFTDLAMPEMDGWETARAIHELRPKLPVVLVTGYGATAQPPSGEQNLVAAIIGKPFDFDQVIATLARVCGDGAAERSHQGARQLLLTQGSEAQVVFDS
jgi:PAS domain S-box-containing protein